MPDPYQLGLTIKTAVGLGGENHAGVAAVVWRPDNDAAAVMGFFGFFNRRHQRAFKNLASHVTQFLSNGVGFASRKIFQAKLGWVISIPWR